MARRYTFAPAAQNPGGAKSLVTIITGANWPIKLKQVLITNADVGGATNIEIRITEISTTGTGTTSTAFPHMPDDTAFTGTCKSVVTVEPTKSNVVFRKRWNLITDFNLDCEVEKLEFIAKAGGTDGYCVEVMTDPGANTLIDVTFDEGA